MNIFERAARGKYRFETSRGVVTVEDLFDMPLTSRNNFNLNEVAIAIDNELEKSAKKNFVAPVDAGSNRSELEAKLDIVKHVIASKLSDQAAAETRMQKAERRRKLLDALQSKENDELNNASKEDILRQLEELDA